MIEPPLVSTVLIFLNEERFIEEAIESVFAQTYENWELLLVDDGSNDASTEIARRYAKQRPDKVSYLQHKNHKNRGPSASRNLGIRQARGDYIALLDADDVWLPYKLEEQVAITKAQPEAGMICGASQYWRSWAVEDDSQEDELIPVGAPQDTLIEPPALLEFLYPLGDGAAPSVNTLLVQRTVAEQVEGFEENFRDKYQLYEDQAFLNKIYLETPVYIAGNCWDRYRQHPDSCVATIDSVEYHTARCFFLNWFKKYLTQRNFQNTRPWELLEEALWSYRHPVLSRLTSIVKNPGESLRELHQQIGDRVRTVINRQ